MNKRNYAKWWRYADPCTSMWSWEAYKATSKSWDIIENVNAMICTSQHVIYSRVEWLGNKCLNWEIVLNFCWKYKYILNFVAATHLKKVGTGAK